MKIGVRGKLFAAVVCLFVLAGVSAGIFLAVALRTTLERHIVEGLRRDADTARLVIEQREGAPVDQLDDFVDGLGLAMATRVTVVGVDGRVWADSTVDGQALAALEDHSGRPEVRQALSHGDGAARRYSTTGAGEQVYVAVPFGSPPRGVVRVSLPLPRIEAELYELRASILIAGLFGLLIAIIVGAIVAHLGSRTVTALVEHARRLAFVGRTGERLRISSEDEFGGLASSLNQLALQLEQHMETLASERDRFEAVLDGMGEAVVAIDEELNIELVNRAALALLGLPADPKGKTLLEVIRVPALYELVRSAPAGNEQTAEFELPGTSRRLLSRARRQRTGGQIIVLLDVTEVRRLETVRRDFVANVSHELRTPVSVIRANLETLLAGALEDPAAAHRFLESSLHHAERITRLISDLLDISRIEAGKYEIELRPVAAAAAVRRCLSALEVKAAERSIVLRADVQEDLTLLVDPQAFEQVLVNLLDNAVKYNRESGQVMVRIVPVESGRCRLEVEDNGPGVPSAHRERLFERFYRVDTGRSRAMGGTGLGLAIVKHLVTAMGGRVGMRPAARDGSIFWIELRCPSEP